MSREWYVGLSDDEVRILRLILGILRGPRAAVYELRWNRRVPPEIYRVRKQAVSDLRMGSDLIVEQGKA